GRPGRPLRREPARVGGLGLAATRVRANHVRPLAAHGDHGPDLGRRRQSVGAVRHAPAGRAQGDRTPSRDGPARAQDVLGSRGALRRPTIARMSDMPSPAPLLELATAWQRSKVLFTLIELGIPAMLAAGSRRAGDLAVELVADPVAAGVF